MDSQKSIEGQWMVSFTKVIFKDFCYSSDKQFQCAGGEGRDVCQGFGGAPLLITETVLGVTITNQIGRLIRSSNESMDSNKFFTGIMSFGSENCGGLRIPSVYTSIAHFYNWIQENIPAE